MNVRKVKILIAFLCVYLCWGSTFLAIRFAIETLPLFLTAAVRFLTAGALMYFFMRVVKKQPRPQPAHWRSAWIIGGLLLFCGNGGVTWAERCVPSGLAALMIATVPLMMILLEWLWYKGPRPSAGVLAGIGLGFTGVWFLLAPDLTPSSSFRICLDGALALLFAAFTWSVGSVYSQRAALPASPFMATGMEMLCGGVLLLALSIGRGELGAIHWEAASLKSILAVVYLIVAGSLIGFTSYIWLLKNVGVARASTYAFVNPVVAIFLGSMLAGELLGPQILIAGGLVLSAVIFISVFHKKTA